MDDLNFREILVKRPFIRPVPSASMRTVAKVTDDMTEPHDDIMGNIVTQADFMREYYPTGHRINSPEHYPDIYKKDPETGKYYLQPVTRCAFAFQQIIATKQIIHICGNDIQFELSKKEKDEKAEKEQDRIYSLLKYGVTKKGLNVLFYDCIRSLKITGDTAIVGYFKDGEFRMKTLSYTNGDRLFPHFDTLTGELEVFARQYYDYDEDGTQTVEHVEVWDKTNIYRFRRDVRQRNAVIDTIRKVFRVSGYKLVSKTPHQFPFIPVAYARDDGGACWSAAQDSIEMYEESFSYLAENNKAYAFPIMYLKGDDVRLEGDLSGSVKAITMDSDGDAGFLTKDDASASFNTQLTTLYKMIYEQSFTVAPPELKSGDLPGVALKLLYSPAIEKAIADSSKLDGFLTAIFRIFKHGWGIESGEYTKVMGLELNVWIQPYVHQNQTELVTNIAAAVQNKFLSKQTATERCPDFPKNDEIDRIMREQKEEQERQALLDMAKQDNATDNAIRQAEATTGLTDGQDINTGYGKGGRPNRTGHTWDENGNYEGESNWDKYNATRSLK